VVEIKSHIFAWLPEDIFYQTGDPLFSRAVNAGLVITSEGVVVVNTTNNPLNARDLLYEIRERTSLPVKYVINTDWRGDHTLGNEVFVDLQAPVISTSVAKIKMREYEQDLERRMQEDSRLQARMRGTHFSLPNQTFDGEMTLRSGNEEIRLLDLGQGALAGDAAVYLPGAKTVFLGALYERGFIPRWGLSDIRAWIEILKRAESMDADTFVPDEGSPGSKNDLMEFREFLEWLAKEMAPPMLPGNSSLRGPSPRMAKVQE
jgi:cyclase